MTIDQEMKALKERGGRIIGCFPLYPPLELFHSLGLTPVVLWGLQGTAKGLENADRRLQPFACSIGRYLAEFLLTKRGTVLDGLFMYNACDTLRNLPEILACGLTEQGGFLPLVKTHIPMTPDGQTQTSDYFRAKIKTLIRDTEEAFSVSFSLEKFHRSLDLYRMMRTLCKDLESRVACGAIGYGLFSRTIHEGHFRPVEDQIRILQRILREHPRPEIDPAKPFGPIIISGILPPPPPIIEAIESSGLRIVGNDIASQARSYGGVPSTGDEPGDYFIDFYQHHVPCPTLLYTADRRMARIKALVQQSGATGFIFLGEKFCEYEYFEIPTLERMLQKMGLAVASIEISAHDRNCAPQVTRIEAFAEILEGLGQTPKEGSNARTT